MNTFSKRKLLTVLFAVLATVCLVCAIAISATIERTFAQGDDQVSAERTPVVTYIIGDSSVTDESGFTFDEETNTYTYADHAAGWSAALDESAARYNEEIVDANLIKVQLASDWIAKEDSKLITYLGRSSNFANGTLVVYSKRNVILNLCGYEINRNLQDKSTVNWGSVIRVDGGFLEITDSDNNGSLGKIKGGKTQNAGGGIVVLKGTLILNGGEISNNTSNTNGGGVYVEGNGSFIMNGGKIQNCFASRGGGVYIENGSFVVNNGDISVNKAANYGGGISISKNGMLQINEGLISNNETVNGGGIYVQGSLIMENGKISGNTASANGGGIFQQSGNIVISNGKIAANKSNKQGGGIYTCSNLTIEGGMVVGNSGNTNGGAIFLMTGAVVKLQGNPIIKDNVLDGTYNPDIEKYEGDKLCNIGKFNAPSVVFGKLTDGADIWLNATTNVKGYAENNTDENGIVINPVNYLSMDGGGKLMSVEGATLDSIYTELIVCSEQDYKTISFKSDFVKGDGVAQTECLQGTDGSVGKYGAVFTYESGKKAVYSFLYGADSSEQSPISVEKVGDENWKDLPLTEAGIYEIKYTIANRTVVFRIVINKKDISNDDTVTYSLAIKDWQENEGKYTNLYNGESKTAPTATVSLNGKTLTSADFTVSYLLNGAEVNELREVGVYNVIITGTGNYTGTVYATELFIIEQNTETSYIVTWQYYDGTEWRDLTALEGAPFTYTSEDYTHRVRVVLSVEGVETRYVYAYGVTEYNLAEGEEESDITKGLSIIDKARDNEIEICNARDYSLALLGEPNYAVNEQDVSAMVTVAPYNLANIVTGSSNTADIVAELNDTTYNANAKELTTLNITLTLGGNKVVLGDVGAEYDYIIKYIDEKGNEIEVEDFILGGTYKIYIAATGDNFTGTLGVAGTVTINQAANSVSFVGTGDWEYGTYDARIHDISGSATWLYDGTIESTEQTYIYYTVLYGDRAVNDTLTRFTALTDDVIAALNALGAGRYTLVAEVDETSSYTGAQKNVEFNVLKANNSCVINPSVIEWQWNDYDINDNPFVFVSAYGSNTAVKTIMDSNGNVIDGLENFVEITDEVVSRLKALNAGTYTIKFVVADTPNYSGLTETAAFTVQKAQNDWITTPDIKSFVAGYYDKAANTVSGAAKYGDVTYKITDADGNVITDIANASVGKYTLTMTVEGTANYEGLTYATTFDVFESTDLTGGEIAGITIACIVAAGLAAAVVFLLIKRKKSV